MERTTSLSPYMYRLNSHRLTQQSGGVKWTSVEVIGLLQCCISCTRWRTTPRILQSTQFSCWSSKRPREMLIRKKDQRVSVLQKLSSSAVAGLEADITALSYAAAEAERRNCQLSCARARERFLHARRCAIARVLAMALSPCLCLCLSVCHKSVSY